MGDSFWGEVVEKAELERQAEPSHKSPHIPQREQAASDTGIASLVAAARAAAAKPDPAVGVLSTPKSLTGGRQAMIPGADVSQVSRRPGPAAEPEPSLLDLSPQERAMVIRLGTTEGRFEGSETAKEAHDRAALVAEATRQGAWTTSEDNTPGRRVDPRGIAGFTAGHGYSR
jgi:hypothetical protein